MQQGPDHEPIGDPPPEREEAARRDAAEQRRLDEQLSDAYRAATGDGDGDTAEQEVADHAAIEQGWDEHEERAPFDR